MFVVGLFWFLVCWFVLVSCLLLLIVSESQVCACEFVAFPKHYYEASIAEGRVTVDGQAVKSEHVLRDGQLIAPWAEAQRNCDWKILMTSTSCNI